MRSALQVVPNKNWIFVSLLPLILFCDWWSEFFC